LIGLLVTFSIAPGAGLLAQSASGGTNSGLPPLPEPLSVLKRAEKFNAVQLGPENAITIREAPPNRTVESVALSSDGKRAAILWGSGRAEVRDVSSGAKLLEFKSLPNDIYFAHNDEWLITTGSGGKVRVCDAGTGKTIKDLAAELGKRKYDVRGVIYRPESDYWAYVDGEEGRIVRLSDGHILANLGEATDFALSTDQRRLWTVSRKSVSEFDTTTWTLRKEWDLRKPISPISEPELAIGSDLNSSEFVAVPSVGGLELYSESPAKQISLEAGRPFVDSSDQLIFVTGRVDSLLDMQGNLLCQWQQRAAHRFISSADGRWFALADFDKLNVWRVADLAKGCKKP